MSLVGVQPGGRHVELEPVQHLWELRPVAEADVMEVDASLDPAELDDCQRPGPAVLGTPGTPRPRDPKVLGYRVHGRSRTRARPQHRDWGRP